MSRRPQRRWPGWLIALAIGMPLVVGGWVVWTTYIAPLPTKDAAGMVRELLDGTEAFSEATSTAGRDGRAVHIYLRFRTNAAGIEHIAGKLGLVPGELTEAQIGALRRDDRMPAWWHPQAELKPGTRWSGARDGWRYDLYHEPGAGVAYMEWTML